MKYRHLFAVIIILAAAFFPDDCLAKKGPSEITIGFIPSEPDKKLKASALKLAKRIQEKVGVTTNIYISKDYQGLISAIKTGKVDFAFFTAMSFVFAEKEAGAKVLLKKVWDENPYYYSVLLSHKDSGISKISDLKDKRLAFVDRKSTSGYLYPSVLFKNKGIDPESYFKDVIFAGNHKAAVNAVRTEKAAAAAVFADDKKGHDNAWSNYYPKEKSQFNVIWVSEPIPNDPFCVREAFYQKYPHTTHEVMFALLEMQDHAEGNLLKKILDISSLQFATSRQYEPVRKMVRTLELEL